MKIKVSEATGPVLDWMVAKCEGYFDSMLNVKTGVVFGLCGELRFSTDWSQGGPIIECGKIDIRARIPDDVLRPNPRFAWKAECVATNPYYCGTGPTPLIAAMRCYVASKLGDEVEVPEELLCG